MPKDTFFNLSGQKQEKIVRSAIEEFTKQGFENGNIGLIAKNAGVAKGSMYQYFENKKELFLYAMRWAIEYFIREYNLTSVPMNQDIFDYFYQSSQPILLMLRKEKDLAVFIQDISFGKYTGLADEHTAAMSKIADEYVLNLIRAGKNNGSIRTDIEDSVLAQFLTGASMKIKEDILKKAKNEGTDIIDDGFEKFESDLNAMIELLKHGMAGRQ